MNTSRRALIAGFVGFVACAPAIVRASSLMKLPVGKPHGYTFRTVVPDGAWSNTSKVIWEIEQRFAALEVHRVSFRQRWEECAEAMMAELNSVRPAT